MKVVQINTFPNKATGNIMMNIHKYLMENGHESYVVWGRGRRAQNKYEICMSTKVDVIFHVAYTRIFDRTGFASWHVTKQLLKKIDKINPDIIHLHNIHGYYINIKLLFKYIKKYNKKVIWTLHDCWPITGHCAYFDAVNCQKWKEKCSNCIQKKTYPKSFCIDNSRKNYKEKKALFSGCDITLVTPCKWLARVVKESYLKYYPIRTIYNGIDPTIFHFRDSVFRVKYELNDNFLILGVASEWSNRKGLLDFIKLEEKLRNISSRYKIILVGLTRKQIKEIPQSILGLERTSNPFELAELYSTADVFFNPTYEDNFPTVNLEAIACGTKVITYDTGGCKETVFGSDSYVLKKGDINSSVEIICSLSKVEKSKYLGNRYNSLQGMIKKYIELYEYSLNRK